MGQLDEREQRLEEALPPRQACRETWKSKLGQRQGQCEYIGRRRGKVFPRKYS